MRAHVTFLCLITEDKLNQLNTNFFGSFETRYKSKEFQSHINLCYYIYHYLIIFNFEMIIIVLLKK